MKIAALIPARKGSQGIPGKNSKVLGDKPLIAYTIESALASKHISKVIISTDDPSITWIAKKYSVDVPFVRPAHLATDDAKTVDVVSHALEWCDNNGIHLDAICLLQPTAPFREDGFIDSCIETFLDSDADSLVSVLPVPHQFNAHWLFEPGADGLLHIATGEEVIIPRRQDLPVNYYRDGSVYITRSQVIRQQRSLYGKKIIYQLSNPKYHVNLDTQEDWQKAEAMLPPFIK